MLYFTTFQNFVFFIKQNSRITSLNGFVSKNSNVQAQISQKQQKTNNRKKRTYTIDTEKKDISIKNFMFTTLLREFLLSFKNQSQK